jgi:hypothetical protein
MFFQRKKEGNLNVSFRMIAGLHEDKVRAFVDDNINTLFQK